MAKRRLCAKNKATNSKDHVSNFLGPIIKGTEKGLFIRILETLQTVKVYCKSK